MVVEAAVMLEAGWNDLTTEGWLIRVDDVTAKRRLMERNRLTETEAKVRMNKQLRGDKYSEQVSAVIDNSNLSLDELPSTVLSALAETIQRK